MAKKICIISPSLNIGGIERALVVLANYFVSNGYTVFFISCLPGERSYSLNKRIHIIEPSFKYNVNFISKLIFYLQIIHFIRRTVLLINPDVVLTFGDWISPLVLLSLSGLKFPVMISDRTSPDYKLGFPVPQLKKWLYPKSAGFIAQTQQAADFKRKQFGNKLNIRIIPNAIRDIKLYPDITKEKIILYVGRFAWEKGPERLIRAFKAIPNRLGWKLHMAGSGPLLNSMKNLVDGLNINDEVVFYGEVKDVDQLYARAEIFVLPSLLEGFPNSLCEAMAAGLPCICFDNIPYNGIFTHGEDGLVIRDGDLDELKATLIRLMEDQSLREDIGTNAKQIRLRLNVDSIGKEVLDFIL